MNTESKRYVAKWLDPKTHPIPSNMPVIGYIKHQQYSEYSPFLTAVYPIYLNDDIFSIMLPHDSNPSWEWRLYKEDIIAWMPLPKPPKI